MDPINFNLQVNVTLGVSKELGDILSKLSNLPPLMLCPVETPAQTEQPAPVEAAPAAAEQKPAEPEKAAPVEAAAPQKEYTTEDVRAAMDRARQRIEGENYKNEKTEGSVKFHSALTERFKDYAGWIVKKKEGQEKPSQLPDSASRAQFIAMCDNLSLSEDGTQIIEDDLPL